MVRLYLTDDHPSLGQGEVTLRVCAAEGNAACEHEMNIQVINCGAFYLYKLHNFGQCSSNPWRYCTNGEGEWESSKGKVCTGADFTQAAHQAGVHPGFCVMKQLGVFPLPPGWDASSRRVSPALNVLSPIYTLEWREALWEKGVLPKNTVAKTSSMRARNRTARSEGEGNSHKATAPPQESSYKYLLFLTIVLFEPSEDWKKRLINDFTVFCYCSRERYLWRC